MISWTFKVSLYYFYILYFVVGSNVQPDLDEDLFDIWHVNGEPTGRALQDVCDCEAVEIVTTKVRYSGLKIVQR